MINKQNKKEANLKTISMFYSWLDLTFSLGQLTVMLSKRSHLKTSLPDPS